MYKTLLQGFKFKCMYFTWFTINEDVENKTPLKSVYSLFVCLFISLLVRPLFPGTTIPISKKLGDAVSVLTSVAE